MNSATNLMKTTTTTTSVTTPADQPAQTAPPATTTVLAEEVAQIDSGHRCGICSIVYPTLGQLLGHMLTPKHKQNEEKSGGRGGGVALYMVVTPKFLCETCGLVVGDASDFKRHLMEQHNHCRRCADKVHARQLKEFNTIWNMRKPHGRQRRLKRPAATTNSGAATHRPTTTTPKLELADG